MAHLQGEGAVSKTQYLCAASAAALVFVAFSGEAARAQTKPPPPKANEVSEVVVTGSFIAGTPEDSAIPVQAVTLQELREAGSPSNLDLVKTFSEIGSVAGE